MALQFIIGPAGSGKSTYVMQHVAEELKKNNRKKINLLTSNTLKYCSIFGIFCTLGFILTGSFIGLHFFNSKEAGDFITILAWLCPFIFISTTLGSVLNGLGFTKTSFYHNLFSAFLRLAFVILLIPNIGIKGYLWGLLASELLCALLHTISVVKYLHT